MMKIIITVTTVDSHERAFSLSISLIIPYIKAKFSSNIWENKWVLKGKLHNRGSLKINQAELT